MEDNSVKSVQNKQVIYLDAIDIIKDESILQKLIARRYIDKVKLNLDNLPADSLLLHPIKSLVVNKYEGTQLHVSCINLNNERIKLILTNIPLFVDVVYPSRWSYDMISSYLYSCGSELTFYKLQEVTGQKIFNNYVHSPVNAVRVFFVNYSVRYKGIEFLRKQLEKGLILFNDIPTGQAYERFLYMYNEIPPFDWWVIEEPTPLMPENYGNNNKVYSIDITKIKQLKDFKYDKINFKELMNPPFATLGWDMETLKIDDLSLPLPDDPNSFMRIYSYCMNLFEKNMTTEWMAAVYCLNNFDEEMFKHNLPNVPSDKLIMIRARNEFEQIKVHKLFMLYADHDISNTFNGGTYDDPWIIKRAFTQGLLEEFVKSIDRDHATLRQDTEKILEKFKNVPPIKTSAEESFKPFWYPFNKFITIDTMPLMKRFYKAAEVGAGQSMNFYLRLNKLPPKVDMEHAVMHDLFLTDYNTPNAKDVMPREKYEEFMSGICKVMEYAICDAICPNRLISKKAIFTESGQLANLVYVSYEDALLRADGMKITNFIWYMCKKTNHLMSEFQFGRYKPLENQESFTGAYVIQPIKGLHKYLPDPGEQHPGDPAPCVHDEHINIAVTNKYVTPELPLDFQSLYPSVMRELNLCPSVKITNAILASRLLADGVKLNRHEYPEEKGMLYWTIDHEGNSAKFGVIPAAISILFDIRVKELKPMVKKYKGIADKLKESLVPHGTKEEQFQAEFDKIVENPTPEQQKVLDEIDDAMELHNYYDAKQLAVKIMMNTIYGTLGYFRSRLCDFDLARTVTCVGRIALRCVIGFHKSQGHIVIYGDTDSTYIRFNFNLYQDIFDIRLTLTRDEYCRRLVVRTFEIKSEYVPKLDEFIRSKFKNGMIKMMPEEILFPIYRRGKKKYIGLKHENPKKITFDTSNRDEYLIKGIETKTRGKTAVLTSSHYRIMDNFMNIHNDLSEIKIVKDIIDYLMNEYQWRIEDCLVFKTYKGEHVKNISVNMLYNRIRLNHPELLPTPYDKFKVAVVEKSFANIFGNKNQEMEKMGNRYELYEVIIKNKLKIDTVYYTVNQIGSSIASYIYYLPQFDTALLSEDCEDRSEWTDKQWDKHNDKLKRAAVSFVEKYAKKILEEKNERISLLDAKHYYKDLGKKYPFLVDVYKLREYFQIENIDEFKSLFTSKTMSDMEAIYMTLDVDNQPATSSEQLTARQKHKELMSRFEMICNEINTILPELIPEFHILCDEIVINRDQKNMLLEINPQIQTGNIHKYIALIKAALQIGIELKNVSRV